MSAFGLSRQLDIIPRKEAQKYGDLSLRTLPPRKVEYMERTRACAKRTRLCGNAGGRRLYLAGY